MTTKDLMAALGLAAGVALFAMPVWRRKTRRGNAAPTAAGQHNATEQKNGIERHNGAFLGVGVENVTPALASHLAIPEGEGLLVEHVAADSPAAKAGIQRHDVLMRVGDQKLLSAEQFVKLIHQQKPGEKCSLELMRQGKKDNVEVTLGEMPANIYERPPRTDETVSTGPRHGQRRNASGRGSEWERFVSLSLQKVGKNEFKASIAYLDDQELERHDFQGTPEQIHKGAVVKRMFRTASGNISTRGLQTVPQSGSCRECDLSPGTGF